MEDVFRRMELRHIRNFILLGVEEDSEPDKRPYIERLNEDSEPIRERLVKVYSDDQTELRKAENEYSDALATTERVYAEIGMKAGARMLYQLLLEDEPRERHNDT